MGDTLYILYIYYYMKRNQSNNRDGKSPNRKASPNDDFLDPEEIAVDINNAKGEYENIPTSEVVDIPFGIDAEPIPNMMHVFEDISHKFLITSAPYLDTQWLEGTCLKDVALTPADYFCLHRFYNEPLNRSPKIIERFTTIYCYIRNLLFDMNPEYILHFPYLSILQFESAENCIKDERMSMPIDKIIEIIDIELTKFEEAIVKIQNTENVPEDVIDQMVYDLLRFRDNISKEHLKNELGFDALEDIYNFLEIAGPYTQDLTRKRLGGKRKSNRRKSRKPRKPRKTMRKNTYKNNMRIIQLNVK